MTDTTTDPSFPEDIVIADTVRWLEKAVIGLNLCPFAKSVHVKGQIHYVVSQATDAEGVALDLTGSWRRWPKFPPKSATPHC